MEQFGLGRLPAKDEKDKGFLASALLPQEAETRPFRYWNSRGWLNQNPKPHCVGYSWTHLLADGPVTHKEALSTQFADDLYYECQRNDEWAGENYDGTSVRAGAKVLQKWGRIGVYRWTWDVQELAQWILLKGPAVAGTVWKTGMFRPNSDGLIKPTGNDEGGHAYEINGVNQRRELLRIRNSWGRGWGKGGYAVISFEDFQALLDADGECCMPEEIKTA